MPRPEAERLQRVFLWEQKTLVVNGRTIAYIDEGQSGARPALLLHGNPTWGFLYRAFIPLLTQPGYRAITPDWVGAWYSDHPRLDVALILPHHSYALDLADLGRGCAEAMLAP